jgi:hypothetical protein
VALRRGSWHGESMTMIENERTKLLANALDRASTACVTVGLLAPIAALLYGATGTAISPVAFGLICAIWIFAAGTLHLIARIILGGLKS